MADCIFYLYGGFKEMKRSYHLYQSVIATNFDERVNVSDSLDCMYSTFYWIIDF